MSGLITTTSGIKSLFDLREDFITLYKASKDEIKYFLDDGLESYVISQNEKFEKLNTFLYRNDRVPFYDTYFPLNLKGTKPNGTKYSIKIADNPKNTFESSKCITIIGDAGSGKSMLMKHFFLHYLRNESEIPLFIELRNLNSFKGSFIDYINELIFNNRLSPNDKILERLLKNGRFIFLLDGYDELHDHSKLSRKEEINQFIDKYRNNDFVLTSRPGVYIESLPRFHNLEVTPIQNKEIPLFIDKQLSILEDKGEFKTKILEVISDAKNQDYSAYLKNPLLLTMFIFTFKNHPEMPKTKNRFYYNVFDTLCTRHDSFSKGGDLHERKTKLKTEDFEEILKWFSYYSYFDGEFNFDRKYFTDKLTEIKKIKKYTFDIEDLIYDLTVSLAIIIIEGDKYKFPHRSLQEYFLALLISQQKSDDIKLKLYSKTYEIILITSLDFNIWTLSEELDPIGFTKYKIEKLSELYNSSYHHIKKKLVSNFLRYIGYDLRCKKIDEFIDDVDSIIEGTPVNNILIPMYLGIYSFIVNVPEKLIINEKLREIVPKYKTEIEKLLEEGDTKLGGTLANYFMDYYLNLNLDGEIKSFLQKIQVKIEKLKMQLEEQENQNIELLNLN